MARVVWAGEGSTWCRISLVVDESPSVEAAHRDDVHARVADWLRDKKGVEVDVRWASADDDDIRTPDR